MYLSRFADATRHAGTCELQTADLVSSKHMGQKWPFALKQTVDFYCNQNTPVYMCLLDAKNEFDRVNHWNPSKKLWDRYVPLHIVKLFIFWYREQEFMVRWGNSLSNDIPSFKWNQARRTVIPIVV